MISEVISYQLNLVIKYTIYQRDSLIFRYCNLESQPKKFGAFDYVIKIVFVVYLSHFLDRKSRPLILDPFSLNIFKLECEFLNAAI